MQLRNLKIDARQENGVLPLMKNNWGVTNGIMFAYVHENITILLSVFSILSFFFMILTWIHKILYM